MTDEDITTATASAFCKLLQTLPSRRERIEAASVLLSLSFELLRGVEGDAYMLGWLEAAGDDLSNNVVPRAALRATQ